MALVTFPHQGDGFFEPAAAYKINIAEGDTIDTILAKECTGNIKPVVWDEIGDYLCRF